MAGVSCGHVTPAHITMRSLVLRMPSEMSPSAGQPCGTPAKPGVGPESQQTLDHRLTGGEGRGPWRFRGPTLETWLVPTIEDKGPEADQKERGISPERR